MVAMAYMLTQAALAKIVNIAAERTGSVLSSVEDEHHFLIDCPAYNQIRQQFSHLSTQLHLQ